MSKIEYSYIRISDNLVVPVGSVFRPNIRKGLIEIYVPGFDTSKPWILEGEVAEAFTAFLNGSISFPINEMGILDIVAGWENAANARALGEITTVSSPLPQRFPAYTPPEDDSETVYDIRSSGPVEPHRNGSPPRLNINAIKRKLTEV